jgi:diacylglycerol O-acyltransferase
MREVRARGGSEAAPAATRRMGGMDSGFLALELPEQPMTNVYLLELGAPPGEGRRLTLEDLHRRFQDRLDYLPAFRWRVLAVPYGLHHPVWADDPLFDLRNHLSEVELGAPGGAAELRRLCARMMAGQLDPARPLWDVTLVNGLAGGRQALAWRGHHCMLDGAATLTSLSRFFAEDDELSPLAREPFAPGALPDRRWLVGRALREQAGNARRLPSLVARTARALKAKQEYERGAPRRPPRSPQDVPPCRVSQAFGPTRHFTTAEFDIADVRLVREAAGVSFTEVVLAVVAGALRSFLLATGELPAEPLVAGCPVGAAEEGVPRQWGNRFSGIVTTLATDLADPWERLATISAVTAVARRANRYFGDELWEEWLSTLPPALTHRVVRRHHRNVRRGRSPASASITISNVPGPARPWRLGDQVVESVWLNGPPNNGVGAVAALFTYSGKVFVGVSFVEDSLGDGSAFTEALGTSLSELVGEASRRAAPAAAG